MANRTITIAIDGDAKGLDRAVKDAENSLNRLAKAAAGIGSIGGSSGGLNVGKTTATDSAYARAQADIKRYQDQTASGERALTDLISKQAEQQFRAKTASYQKSAAEFQKSLAKINAEQQKAAQASQNSSSLFDAVLGGNLGAQAITKAISLAEEFYATVFDLGKTSVQLAADFQGTTNAIAVFSGSVSSAKNELRDLDAIALKTPGLTLKDAESGYQRLRALNFEARISQDLIKGLGTQRVLSGAGADAIDRVITNIIQLKTGAGTAQDVRQTIGQLPTLLPVFQKAFGTQDFGAINTKFKTDPDALKKFAAELGKTESAQTGLNVAVEKGYDALTQAGRLFGEPLLDPLTKDVQDLTGFLIENQDTFKSWGQSVADVLRGASDAARGFSVIKNATLLPRQQEVIGNAASGAASGLFGLLSFGATSDLTRLGVVGDRARQAQERQNSLTAVVVGSDRIKRIAGKSGLESADLSRDNTIQFTTPQEQKAQDLADEQEKIGREKAAAKAFTDNLKEQRKIESEINDSYYKVEQARLGSYLNVTAEQQLESVKAVAQVRQAGIAANLAETQKYYADVIKFGGLSGKELADAQREQTVEVGKLNADLKVAQFQAQKEIAQKEREILTQRRAALTQFNQLQIKDADSFAGKQIFDITRQINTEQKNLITGYGEIQSITEQHYAKLADLTLANFQLQLQDDTLTKEQRTNLTKEFYQNEQSLAEDNRRKQLEIQDSSNAAFITRLDKNRQQASEIYKSIGELFSLTQTAFFNPQTFSGSTLNDLQKVLLRKPETDILKGKIAGARNDESVALAAKNSFYQNQSQTGTESPQETAAIDKASAAYRAALDASGNYENQLSKISDSIPKAYFEFEKLAKAVGEGNVNAFDDAAKASLIYRQTLEASDAQAEIDHIQDKIDLENKLAVTENRIAVTRDLIFELGQAQRAKEKLGFEQNIQTVEQYRNSLDGLKERLAKLRAGDVAEITGVKESAQKQIIGEQIATAEQTTVLQERLAHVGEDAADRYRNAWLKATLDVRDAQIQAVESQIDSQIRLADAAIFHGEQVRANVLKHLAEQKSISESVADSINNLYDAAGAKIDKFFAKIPVVGNIAATFAKNSLSNITRNLLDTFLPPEISAQFSSTGNPQLDEAKTQTNYLKKIAENTGTNAVINNSFKIGDTGSGAAGGLGGIAGILQKVLGGGSGSGGGLFSGSQGGGVYNLAGGGELTAQGGTLGALIGNRGGGTFSTESIVSKLKSVFSTGDGGLFGKGGIFGKEGFGVNSGTAGGIAAGAQILGGLISSKFGGSAVGRRVGGVLSGAGTGASIGLLLGGPIGAALGAFAGGVIGFFTSGGQRKKDEQTRTGYINDALSALGQFDALIADVKAHRTDGASALTQGQSLVQSVRTQYLQAAGALKDNKTRGIALKDVSRIDDLAAQKLAELKRAADIADASAERVKRILPEFAGGTYIDPRIKNYNGQIPGAFDGRDSLIARLSYGEMVLNPNQVKSAISRAGFDVFAGIVPNYKTPTVQPQSSFAGGGAVVPFAAQSSGDIHLTIENAIDADGIVTTVIQSDSGRRVFAKVNNKLKSEGVIK